MVRVNPLHYIDLIVMAMFFWRFFDGFWTFVDRQNWCLKERRTPPAAFGRGFVAPAERPTVRPWFWTGRFRICPSPPGVETGRNQTI